MLAILSNENLSITETKQKHQNQVRDLSHKW